MLKHTSVINYRVSQGFSAAIPDGFLSQLQSLQGNGVIDYIGTFKRLS